MKAALVKLCMQFAHPTWNSTQNCMKKKNLLDCIDQSDIFMHIKFDTTPWCHVLKFFWLLWHMQLCSNSGIAAIFRKLTRKPHKFVLARLIVYLHGLVKQASNARGIVRLSTRFILEMVSRPFMSITVKIQPDFKTLRIPCSI